MTDQTSIIMGAESGRHLWRAATISLLFWVFTWILAFAILPFAGSRFWYLVFGIGEPFIFTIVFLAPERTAFWALFIVLLVVAQFVLHVVAFILRILAITRPIIVSELLDIVFMVIEGIAVFIYIWYSVCAARHFWYLQSEHDLLYNTASIGSSEYDKTTGSSSSASSSYTWSAPQPGQELKQRHH